MCTRALQQIFPHGLLQSTHQESLSDDIISDAQLTQTGPAAQAQERGDGQEREDDNCDDSDLDIPLLLLRPKPFVQASKKIPKEI